MQNNKSFKIYKLSMILLVLVAVSSYLSFVHYKKTEKPMAGYINDAWFEFPKDRYTFVISVRQHDDGKQYIDDVIWGYKYPSMQPLLQDSKMRGDFMWIINSDWVRIGIIPHVSSKETEMLERRVNVYLLGQIQGFAYTPDSTPNKFGLYHASMSKISNNDRKSKVEPPQNIFWYKKDEKIITYITCKNYDGNNTGALCEHTTIDPVTDAEISISFDSKNLSHWQDIQTQTLSILHSFIKKHVTRNKP